MKTSSILSVLQQMPQLTAEFADITSPETRLPALPEDVVNRISARAETVGVRQRDLTAQMTAPGFDPAKMPTLITPWEMMQTRLDLFTVSAWKADRSKDTSERANHNERAHRALVDLMCLTVMVLFTDEEVLTLAVKAGEFDGVQVTNQDTQALDAYRMAISGVSRCAQAAKLLQDLPEMAQMVREESKRLEMKARADLEAHIFRKQAPAFVNT